MTDTKHTPGKWVADGKVVEAFDSPLVGDIAITGPGCIVSWDRRRSDAENASNAQLIAAAPELLAALKALVYAVQISNTRSESVLYAMSASRDAIAKAKGPAA